MLKFIWILKFGVKKLFFKAFAELHICILYVCNFLYIYICLLYKKHTFEHFIIINMICRFTSPQ